MADTRAVRSQLRRNRRPARHHHHLGTIPGPHSLHHLHRQDPHDAHRLRRRSPARLRHHAPQLRHLRQRPLRPHHNAIRAAIGSPDDRRRLRPRQPPVRLLGQHLLHLDARPRRAAVHTDIRPTRHHRLRHRRQHSPNAHPQPEHLHRRPRPVRRRRLPSPLPPGQRTGHHHPRHQRLRHSRRLNESAQPDARHPRGHSPDGRARRIPRHHPQPHRGTSRLAGRSRSTSPTNSATSQT